MTLRVHRAMAATLSLAAAILACGCPKEDESEPSPPAYAPADVANLISHDGGTGGGPNMGTVTVVLFDDDDESATPLRLPGTEVLLRHGGGTLARRTTDAEGKAEFSGITPGAVTFTAVKTGFANLTIVDMNAATAALGMRRKAIRITGVVSRELTANSVELELLTKEWDAFDGKAKEKYGAVTRSEAASGNNWDYELWVRGGVDESFVVREKQADGKVVHRQVYLVDQDADPATWTDRSNVNFSFTNATPAGLHTVTFTITGVHAGAQKVVSWYEENLVRYASYTCATPSAGTWTVVLQMPENKTNAMIVHETYLDADGDTPVESWQLSYSSGAEASAGTQTVAEAFQEVHGEFLNPVANGDLFLVEARYNGRSHLNFGVKVWGDDDYSIRAPAAVALDLRALELQGTGGGALGTIVAHRANTITMGASDTPHDFDFTGYRSKAVDMTAPTPAGVPDPNPFSALTGPYPSTSKFLALPFMVGGTIAGGSITWPLRYGDITGISFLLLVIAEEQGASGKAAASFYIRGGLTDPLGTLGATPSLSLLDAARVHGPADGATLARDQIRFAWTADAELDVEGYQSLDVKDADGQTVWSVQVRPTTRQFTLEELPVDLNGFNLVKGDAYTFQVMSVHKTGLAFDSFLVDSIPQKIEDMATAAEVLRSSTSTEVRFTVAP